MKLIWHIGPHKTGTTSLQRSLGAHAASRRSTFYYPPTPELGPGHALLAWRLLGLNGRPIDETVINQEIDKAAKAGFDKVVISSEEFSRALMKPERFAPLARVTAAVDCELVLTLRPLRERLMPELQELIKNGHRVNLANPQEMLDVAMTRPGLRPDFLSAAIEEIGAASVTVAMVDSAAPRKLFDAMSVVIGGELTSAASGAENASYPYLKTAWLDLLNRHAGVPAREARSIAEAAFGAALKEHRELGNVPYPPLPVSIERYLNSVWDLQMAYLRSLQQAGRIRWL